MKKTRRTRQKQTVLCIVHTARNHPTAREVYEKAKTILPGISLGTVYRILDQLADHGEIQRVQLGDRPMRFDSNTGAHYHIRCIQCGRVDDLPISFRRDLESEIQASIAYQVLGHVLEAHGFCPQCKATERQATGGMSGVH